MGAWGAWWRGGVAAAAVAGVSCEGSYVVSVTESGSSGAFGLLGLPVCRTDSLWPGNRTSKPGTNTNESKSRLQHPVAVACACAHGTQVMRLFIVFVLSGSCWLKDRRRKRLDRGIDAADAANTGNAGADPPRDSTAAVPDSAVPEEVGPEGADASDGVTPVAQAVRALGVPAA